MNRPRLLFASLALAGLLAGCAAAELPAATPEATATVSPPPTSSATPNASAVPDVLVVIPLSATPDPYAPHGDGDYIIGAHIAAGRWQSDGQAEGECYWTTRKANGIILKSYLGPPGGTLDLGGYDYEVQFRNCGLWHFLSP